MNRKEHLMVVAMEECDEVSQRISKALRFGLFETQPGNEENNERRIRSEYTDLVAAMELIGFISLDRSEIDAKKIKIEKYLRYSESLGATS